MSSEVETSLIISRGCYVSNTSTKQQEISRLHFVPLEMTNKILLDSHMSIGGGARRAIERACSIQCLLPVMSSEVETSLIISRGCYVSNTSTKQ
jgi:hypothetical protein